MAKFIYIIQDCDSGFFKIGRSKNPNHRIKCMQTGSSGILRLVSTFEVGSNKAEKAIHDKLKEYRRSGEWFDAPIEIVIQVTSSVTQLFQDDDSEISLRQARFGKLAKDRDMTGESIRLLLFLLSEMDFDNYINISQMEISDELQIARSSVCRAMSVLTSKNVILVYGKGMAKRIRFNPIYGTKARASSIEEQRMIEGCIDIR